MGCKYLSDVKVGIVRLFTAIVKTEMAVSWLAVKFLSTGCQKWAHNVYVDVTLQNVKQQVTI